MGIALSLSIYIYNCIVVLNIFSPRKMPDLRVRGETGFFYFIGEFSRKEFL